MASAGGTTKSVWLDKKRAIGRELIERFWETGQWPPVAYFEWCPAGGTVDVPDDEGAQLCAGGLAEPIADRGEPEAAVPPDTAEKRGRGRPRKPLTKE